MDFSAPNKQPVIVIGSGFGGFPAATALVEAGFDVVILERGDHFDRLSAKTDSFSYEVDALPFDIAAREWDGPVTVQRAMGVGGSALYYQGIAKTPDTKVYSSWGLPTDELSSIAKEVSDYIKVAGENQPPHALNPVSQQVFDAANKLDWDPAPAPVSILSQAHDGRPPCNRCGLCVYGCRPGDKSGPNNTWLARASATGKLKVITQAHVKKIILKSASRAEAVEFDTPQGKQTLFGSAIVLSAGALETPYLLKSSRQQYAPKGIGNSNVGRNMCASVLYSAIYAAPTGMGGHSGIPIDMIIDRFRDDGIVLCQGRNLAGITGPVSLAKYYAKSFGPVGLRSWMRDYYEKIVVLAGFCETSSDASYGLIGDGVKSFDIKLSQADMNAVTTIKQRIEEWAQQAKLLSVSVPKASDASISGAMLRSTCKIGKDERTSAVTPQGQLRGYDNIVVSDASVLGAGLIAHPSLPLQVLGLYFGRELAKRLSA